MSGIYFGTVPRGDTTPRVCFVSPLSGLCLGLNFTARALGLAARAMSAFQACRSAIPAILAFASIAPFGVTNVNRIVLAAYLLATARLLIGRR